MPFVVIDGINTFYQVLGSGPPLLMYAPGGFNAVLDAWRRQGKYAELRFLEHLPQDFTCIAFDRRECGRSGGRLQRITWADYAAQGRGLLEHLGVRRAHVMGGCMGVSCAAAFATAYPDVAISLVLFWPVGGPKYRLATQERFATHLAYVAQNGLQGVAKLAVEVDASFGADPRLGPWATVLKTDEAFRADFVEQDPEAYKRLISVIARSMFNRDTAPGPEPEELMRLSVPALIIPGQDVFHGTSAARFLEECLPNAAYWDVPADLQTEPIVAARVISFLRVCSE